MTDPRQFGLVCNLAGFDEVVKADSKSHHLGDAGEPAKWRRACDWPAPTIFLAFRLPDINSILCLAVSMRLLLLWLDALG